MLRLTGTHSEPWYHGWAAVAMREAQLLLELKAPIGKTIQEFSPDLETAVIPLPDVATG